MIVVCHVVFELRMSDFKVIILQLCNFKVMFAFAVLELAFLELAVFGVSDVRTYAFCAFRFAERHLIGT